MKKNLKILLVCTIIASILSLLSTILLFGLSNSKTENTTYYRNVRIVEENNEYFIRGIIEFGEPINYDSLYIDLTFVYSDNTAVNYTIYQIEFGTKSINLKKSVNEYDFDFDKSPQIKAVAIRYNYDSEPVYIKNIEEFSSGIFSNNIPSFIALIITICCIGASLIIVIKLVEIKHSADKVRSFIIKSNEAKDTKIEKIKNIKCPYCESINKSNVERCTKCGANLLKM